MLKVWFPIVTTDLTVSLLGAVCGNFLVGTSAFMSISYSTTSPALIASFLTTYSFLSSVVTRATTLETFLAVVSFT